MRFLADENIPPDLVQWLRGQGCDVLSVREERRGAEEANVLRWAREEGRVLLTSDRDFGGLLFRQGMTLDGILFLRFRVGTLDEFLSLFEKYWLEMRQFPPRHMLIVSNRPAHKSFDTSIAFAIIGTAEGNGRNRDMRQIMVRNLDDKLVARLKKRAREAGRPLQDEVRSLLENGVRFDSAVFRRKAARLRRLLQGRDFDDSAALVREDRER